MQKILCGLLFLVSVALPFTVFGHGGERSIEHRTCVEVIVRGQNHDNYVNTCDEHGGGGTDGGGTTIPNNGPVFDTIDAKTVIAGETITFVVSAIDADGDTLSYSATNLPQDAVFDSATRQFSWTTRPEAQGMYEVNFRVTDGKGLEYFDAMTVQIMVVSGNHAPAFQGPSYASTTVSSTLSVVVSAADSDGDALSITANLPMYAGYATSTGVFTWTPVIAGTSTASFYAYDGMATTTHVIALEAFALSTPTSTATSTAYTGPVFSGFNPPMNATATERYSYDVEATDPQNDPITFELFSAPTGMTVGSSTGSIEWTPDASQATSTPYAVTLRISDGTNSTSTSYSITVNPANSTTTNNSNTNTNNTTSGSTSGGNSPQVVLHGSGGDGSSSVTINPTSSGTPQFVNFAPPGHATSSWLYVYDVEAIDPEGNPLSFSLLEKPEGMQILPDIGFIYWTPTLAQATTTPYTVTIQVSDGNNATQSSFQIVVDAPVNNSAPLQVGTSESNEGFADGFGDTPKPKKKPTNNISTSTPVAAQEPTNAGGSAIGARLLAGLSYYFGNWIGYIVGLIVLLAFLAYIYFTRDREDLEDVEQEFGISGEELARMREEVQRESFAPKIIGD